MTIRLLFQALPVLTSLLMLGILVYLNVSIARAEIAINNAKKILSTMQEEDDPVSKKHNDTSIAVQKISIDSQEENARIQNHRIEKKIKAEALKSGDKDDHEKSSGATINSFPHKGEGKQSENREDETAIEKNASLKYGTNIKLNHKLSRTMLVSEVKFSVRLVHNSKYEIQNASLLLIQEESIKGRRIEMPIKSDLLGWAIKSNEVTFTFRERLDEDLRELNDVSPFEDRTPRLFRIRFPIGKNEVIGVLWWVQISNDNMKGEDITLPMKLTVEEEQ